MREYINKPVKIDGRKIPYPVFTAADYLELHDKTEDIDEFMEKNYEIYKTISQIMAIKQSCFLLRNTTHSCQSLSDDLYDLKLRLISELKEKYNYKFDDRWVEDQLEPQKLCTW